MINGGSLGLVEVDSGTRLSMTRDYDARATTLFGVAPIIWGAGTLDTKGRSVGALAATATLEFPSAGFTLNINGATTADSHTGAAPDVLNGGITVNPANIDAAAGAAGFGGEAFVLAGSALRKAVL